MKIKNKDRVGQRYGRLIIKELIIKRESGRSRQYFKCLCDCGNTLIARSDSITSGRTISCGCYNKENNLIKPADIINQRFGRLIVIKRLDKKTKSGQYIYKCICDCGNETEVIASSLIDGTTKSCGCYVKDLLRKNKDKRKKVFNEKYVVEKTGLHAIKKEKPNTNNTSGIKGVCWDKEKNKWVAQITYQGKNYHLGRFHSINDAKKVREMAREILFVPVLEKYTKNKEDVEIIHDISPANLRDLIYKRLKD